MRRISTVLLVAVVAVLAACSGGEARTVTVEFRLADFDTAFYDCQGTGGYDDIGPGSPVTIRNGAGEVVATSKLGEGQPSSNGRQEAYCDWTTKVEDVPAADFYAVEIADRGEITTSAEDLAANDWVFEIALGEL
jgi:hypothetical protein